MKKGSYNLEDLIVMGHNFTLEDLATIKELDHVINAERKLTVNMDVVRDATKKQSMQVNFIENNLIFFMAVTD